MSHRLRFGYAAGSAFLTVVLAPPSLAQGSADEEIGGSLDEIVVTARKREENLLDVPIAVTAITAEQIQVRGIKSVEDAIDSDPSLNFDQGFAPYDTRIVIRGLSPTRGRPNVAALVDGIDISSEAIGVAGGSLLVNPRLLDIERIEVVKGPQSALYGRSAFAGAIQYVTQDPTDELEATAGAEFGNYARQEYRLGISGPLLGETLGFRVTGLSYSEDGAYRNQITGNRVGGAEGAGVALSLKWEPAESFDAKFRYEYSADQFEQPPQAFVTPNTFNEIPFSASSCTTPGTARAGGGVIRDARCPGLAQILESVTGNRGLFTDHRVAAYRGAVGDVGNLQVRYTPDYSRSVNNGLSAPDFPGSDRNVNRLSLVLNWNVPWGTFSSLTGYTDADVYTSIDLDHFGAPGATLGADASSITQNLTTFGDTWQNSQELRFTSDFDAPLNFIGGLQYWKEHVNQSDSNYTAIASGTLCQVVTSGALPAFGIGAVTPFGPPGTPVPAYVQLRPGSCGAATAPIGTRVTSGVSGPVFAAGPGSTATESTSVSQYIDEVAAARDTTFTDRVTDHNSAYLQINWDITDAFAFSVEGRYVDEDNEVTGPDPIEITTAPFNEAVGAGPGTVTLCGSNGPCTPRGPVAGAPPGTLAGVPNGPRGFAPVRPVVYKTFKRNDSYFTPRVSLDWKPMDDMLVYLSYGEGEKPGGFSTITIGAFGIDANADNSPDDIEFEPERIKEYELGFKAAFFDRRLVVNSAIFREDFTDKQVSTQQIIGNTLGNVIKNAAGARIDGVELSAQWRPIDRLTIAGGYTWLDGKYTDYAVTGTGAPEISRVGNCTRGYVDASSVFQPLESGAPPTGLSLTCLIDRTGNTIEDTPEHSLTAQFTWRDQLGGTGLRWFAELDNRYQSKRFLEDDNTIWVDPFWLTDLRIGLEGNRWSLVAFADNLLDDDTIRSAGTGPGNANMNFRLGQVFGQPQAAPVQTVAAPLIPTLVFANLPDPRTYGLRFSYRFGGSE